MSNLALTYSEQGRWDETKELEAQVIKLRTKVLGEKYPNTLTSMSDLTSTYWKQERWDKADGLEVQVVDLSQSALGKLHPDTQSYE